MKSNQLAACLLLTAMTACHSQPGLAADGVATAMSAPTQLQAPAAILQKGSISRSDVDQHLESGLQSLSRRAYKQAQVHLSAAAEQLKAHHLNETRMLRCQLALGEALSGEQLWQPAERHLSEALALATQQHDSTALARAQAVLAEVARQSGNIKKAQALAQQVLETGSDGSAATAAPQCPSVAAAHLVMGRICSSRHLSEAAVQHLRLSRQLFEQCGNQYEAAEAGYQLAMQLRGTAEDDQCAMLFEQAFTTFDSTCRFNAPLAAAPYVVSEWDERNPRSRQIADPQYPLRYQIINGLRVAASPVRSENVIAVIVSLANCSRSRMQLAVGPVSLEQVEPKHKSFTFVPPEQLDVPLEEHHVTDLTWRRRWLNHIEKTRLIPGFLKGNELQVDNFFGNNTFGIYGNWPTLACDQSAVGTREQLLYSKNGGQDSDTINFLSQAAADYRATFLEPGEAKTGLVFFLQERFDKAELKVIVGNTIVEIPFASAGPR